MKYRKWLIVLLVVAIAAVIYMVSDSFAAKKREQDMYPKIAYLDGQGERFNSFVIGGADAEALTVEGLNRYYGNGAAFYHLSMPGGTIDDYEKITYQLFQGREPQHIVLHLGLPDLLRSSSAGEDSGETPFNAQTGMYENGRVQEDTPPGNDLDVYRETYGAAFAATPSSDKSIETGAAESVKRIKQYAEERGATFQLIAAPTFAEQLEGYEREPLRRLWSELAAVTPFWDFAGRSSIGSDMRYFYDRFHYRESVGDMMLANIFDDGDVYSPPDFGHLTTSENVEARAERAFAAATLKGDKRTVPIVVYHHIDDNPYKPSSLITSTDKFRSDMEAFRAAGFQTVFVSELIDYVDGRGELPDNPLAITFDDGYLSNYEHAYPVLKELGMKATISIIGWSVGREKHRIAGAQFYPHFTWEQAKEMYDSGVIDIQNHTFDMHESNRDNPAVRTGVLQMEGESSGQYAAAFLEDSGKIAAQIESRIGNKVQVFVYPFGYYQHLSEQLLLDSGYRSTLSTKPGINEIEQGDPSTLFAMKRINGSPGVPSDVLVGRLQGSK